jgi:hypothetical protein
VYDNKGSSLRTTNYLVQEAKEAGGVDSFFGAPGSPNQTAEEVMAILDGNVKGLRKDDANFYSLALSPSTDELTHTGNYPKALEKYTQHVMDDYAKNFTLKNGKELGEKIWSRLPSFTTSARTVAPMKACKARRKKDSKPTSTLSCQPATPSRELRPIR